MKKIVCLLLIIVLVLCGCTNGVSNSTVQFRRSSEIDSVDFSEPVFKSGDKIDSDVQFVGSWSSKQILDDSTCIIDVYVRNIGFDDAVLLVCDPSMRISYVGNGTVHVHGTVVAVDDLPDSISCEIEKSYSNAWAIVVDSIDDTDCNLVGEVYPSSFEYVLYDISKNVMQSLDVDCNIGLKSISGVGSRIAWNTYKDLDGLLSYAFMLNVENNSPYAVSFDSFDVVKDGISYSGSSYYGSIGVVQPGFSGDVDIAMDSLMNPSELGEFDIILTGCYYYDSRSNSVPFALSWHCNIAE